MKFRLTAEHVYDWPVTVSIPDPDKPGEVIEQGFKMRFRAMPRDEAEALDAEIASLPPREAMKREDDVLRRVCLGWDDAVIDDAGKAVPFSSEALEQAMRFSWFRIGCYRAYRQSLQGEAAKRGN